MVTMVALCAVSIGLWSWPARARLPMPARRRTRGRWLPGLRLPVPAVFAIGAGALAGLTVSLPAGIAATLLVGTVAGLVRGELAAGRRRRERSEILVAVRMLARELRAGATGQVAVTATASAAGGAGATLMSELALQIAVDRSTRRASSLKGEAQREVSDRLAAGWALSARYGVPWANLLDALALDLSDRADADTALAAQVAGPRMSGYVLAVLPVMGLALGSGMGADPIAVLTGPGLGGLLLVLGTGLTCAGLAWAAKLVRP